jgi:hypothetical protein
MGTQLQFTARPSVLSASMHPNSAAVHVAVWNACLPLGPCRARSVWVFVGHVRDVHRWHTRVLSCRSELSDELKRMPRSFKKRLLLWVCSWTFVLPTLGGNSGVARLALKRPLSGISPTRQKRDASARRIAHGASLAESCASAT